VAGTLCRAGHNPLNPLVQENRLNPQLISAGHEAEIKLKNVLGEARALNEDAERAKEQACQQSINKAVQDGQRIIDQATADAAAARASADGVQLAADNLARRLATSEASANSCTAAASKAAARAAAVLADVFKRADPRTGDLAAMADQARARGLTCEQAYISLREQ